MAPCSSSSEMALGLVLQRPFSMDLDGVVCPECRLSPSSLLFPVCNGMDIGKPKVSVILVFTRVRVLQSSRLGEEAKVPARKYFVLCNIRPKGVTVKGQLCLGK